MKNIGKRLCIVLCLLGVLSALIDYVNMQWVAIAGSHYTALSMVLICCIVILAIAVVLFSSSARKRKSAIFMGWWEQFFLLNRWHNGFVLDGRHKRLSQKTSCESVLTVGGMGRGKSSSFVMPNIYTLENGSFVIADTSGEIYEQTSGYLASKGYEINVFNLMNTKESLRYNPLANLKSYTEIAQASELIVKSSLPNDRDPFWSMGAIKIIRIMMQCLRNRGKSNQTNLANVKYLLNNFDAHLTKGKRISRIDNFVLESTLIKDASTFNDYKGFLGGNERTMQSFLSTADTALSAIGNPDIAKLTSSNDINFKRLRKRKTALYILARQQDLKFYSFLLNLFYTDLFNSLLTDHNADQLPVYLLLDEFGHLTIPNFDTFATTARKYRVAFWIFLQSLTQLESRYGAKEAQTIRDGLQTALYLPGVGTDTAQELERRLGKIKIPVERGGHTVYLEENLIDLHEIVQMQDDSVLVVHSNKPPIVFPVTAFYKQRTMLKAAKCTPHPFPCVEATKISYVKL